MSCIRRVNLYILTFACRRRTVNTNISWRERQMILTKQIIYFARPDWDIVVDKIAVADIMTVGKVTWPYRFQFDLTNQHSLNNERWDRCCHFAVIPQICRSQTFNVTLHLCLNHLLWTSDRFKYSQWCHKWLD